MRTLCGHISLEIYVPTMSALCPHNISRRIYVSRGRCCADIVRTYISRDICLHNVRTISFFGFQLGSMTIFSSRPEIVFCRQSGAPPPSGAVKGCYWSENATQPIAAVDKPFAADHIANLYLFISSFNNKHILIWTLDICY